MPKHAADAELLAFAAVGVLSLPLVPFAPAALGIWGRMIAGRDPLPIPHARQARLPLALFTLLSGLCEVCWGHDFVADYGDVWFDNLFAGLIVPGGIVCLAMLLLRAVRDAAMLGYRHRHSDE